jgi:hypothetical protein
VAPSATTARIRGSAPNAAMPCSPPIDSPSVAILPTLTPGCQSRAAAPRRLPRRDRPPRPPPTSRWRTQGEALRCPEPPPRSAPTLKQRRGAWPDVVRDGTYGRSGAPRGHLLLEVSRRSSERDRR